jgi:hypothetical protein
VSTYRARRGTAFSEDERRGILDRYRRAWTVKDRAELRSEAVPDDIRAELAAAADEYVDAVPILSLSRDPFTDQVFETSLDPYGIDGLWWAYEHEYRPYVAPTDAFFAWTGALRLGGPIPEWSLKAMVGPEAPYVLPRILDHEDVRAVVSQVAVGPHTGYPIVYFARPTPHQLERVDDWGHRVHYVIRPDGSPAAGHATNDDAENDYDLGPWMNTGKLMWIEPGDDDLMLKTGTAGSPFLDLPGERRRRYIQEGKDWLA